MMFITSRCTAATILGVSGGTTTIGRWIAIARAFAGRFPRGTRRVRIFLAEKPDRLTGPPDVYDEHDC